MKGCVFVNNNKLEENLKNFKINQHGENIYKGIDSSIRRKMGITREELAKMSAGLLSERTIHNYETGKTDPSASNVVLISKLLGTSTDALFKKPLKYSYSNFNNTIPKLNFVPNKGFGEKEAKYNFDFTENLGESNRLYYLILENDSTLLGVPKGSKIIIDRNGDYKNDLIEGIQYVGLFKTPDVSEIYISPFYYSPTPRKKNNYIYYDIDKKIVQGSLEDIETYCFGIVKKAIIDF